MKIILLAILIWSILDSGWSLTDEEKQQFKADINTLTAGILYLRNQSEVDQAQIQVLTRRTENQTREMEVLRREIQSLNHESQEERVEALELTSAQHEDRLTHLEDTLANVNLTATAHGRNDLNSECDLGYTGENCDVCDEAVKYFGMYDGNQNKSSILTFSGPDCTTFTGTEVNGRCAATEILNGTINRLTRKVTYSLHQPKSARCNGFKGSLTADLDEHWNFVRGRLRNGQTFYDIKH